MTVSGCHDPTCLSGVARRPRQQAASHAHMRQASEVGCGPSCRRRPMPRIRQIGICISSTRPSCAFISMHAAPAGSGRPGICRAGSRPAFTCRLKVWQVRQGRSNCWRVTHEDSAGGVAGQPCGSPAPAVATLACGHAGWPATKPFVAPRPGAPMPAAHPAGNPQQKLPTPAAHFIREVCRSATEPRA